MPFIILLLSVLVIAADQVLKLLVIQYLKPDGVKTIFDGLLSFVYVENRGAAFSILQNQRWLFIGITLVICILIIYALFRYGNHEFFSYAASALIVGGGIGNLIDRVLKGYVVDYIHVSFFPAIFNFGDCCVTVGTVFLMIHVLFFADDSHGAEKVLRTK
ncbi:signal peptidase II [Caproicibacter sp.]|uniref:signal peptidase II n=1 Tax=Caproicibacter sp. TaxID=2814884 RepID=UPI0039898668